MTKTRQFEAEKRVAIYKRMKIFISQLRVAANVSLASPDEILKGTNEIASIGKVCDKSILRVLLIGPRVSISEKREINFTLI